jgi:hypothetical protein
MDAELLQTPQEIRGGLYVLDLLGVVALFVWMVRGGSQIAVQLQSVVTARWKNSANMMFGKKQYEALAKHCSVRLKEFPNDEWALWWSARTHRELGNRDFSQRQFQRIVEIAPGWRKAVEPYLGTGIVNDAPQ